MRSLLLRFAVPMLAALLSTTGVMLPTIRCSGLSEGGEVRGLIIGIDAYQHYRPLKGAVADARDIEIGVALRSAPRTSSR